MRPEPHQPAQRADPPPGVQEALDSGYCPDAPLFRSPKVNYITLCWAFRRLLRHRSRNKGAGRAWRYTGGAWAWKPLPGRPLSPIPEPIGAGDLTKGKVFTGPRGTLMRGSHGELCFLHWEERGWVKLQRSGRKLECIPQWESILGGGCMTRGRRPHTRRPSRASPSPAPSSPLARQPRPPAAPRPPRAPPRAPLPAQLRICGPPWARWAASNQSRI